MCESAALKTAVGVGTALYYLSGFLIGKELGQGLTHVYGRIKSRRARNDLTERMDTLERRLNQIEKQT